MLRIILSIPVIIYGLVWFLIFLTGGGTYSGSNKNDIDESIKYYHSIRDDLLDIARYVEIFEKENKHYPDGNTFGEWVEDRKDFNKVILSETTNLHYVSIPKYVTERFGPKGNDGFAITIWTGDEYLYYASWVNGNSADVKIEDFGIPRNVSAKHFIFALVGSILLLSKNLTRKLMGTRKNAAPII